MPEEIKKENKLTPHQAAALNYEQHISLTANAGSGKTFVLSQRYVKIALEKDVSLKKIVAITFTEKAASELYKKISDVINKRLESTTEYQEKKILERMRRQLVSANISTIHAFCIDILKEHPLEAQLDANFIPIDNELTDELIQLSVEEVIKLAINDPLKENDLKKLIRLFASKNILAEELIELIKKRKNLQKVAESIYTQSEEEISRYFYDSFVSKVSAIISADKLRIISSIEAVNNAVLAMKPDNTTAIEIRHLLYKFAAADDFDKLFFILIGLRDNLLTAKLTVKIKGYLSTERELLAGQIEFLENYFSEIKNFEIAIDHDKIEIELARTGKSLISFFNDALRIYSEKKRQNSYLDFEDILIFTQKILAIDSVRESLYEKYDYIMIDEYQDTNQIQYEIFMPILNYLQKGNLFIVGDEKQSIYMFRDADLQVFNRTKREIASSAGEENLLMLPDSFRMAPAISLFTNYLFGRLFENPNHAYNEVEYSELVCAKNEETPGCVELMFADANNDSEGEADLVARRILSFRHELIESGEEALAFNDIAVLCRKRDAFSELEKSFTKYKIPFIIVGGKGFYQRQVVFDIHNYLSFLLNKEDDKALVAILRSPFFSVSDTDLYEISLERKFSFWENLISYAEKKEFFKDIVSRLSENLFVTRSYDLTSLLRKVISESCYIATLAAKANGIQELANLEKLLSISNNFAMLSFKTLYDFINYLKEAISEMDDEGQAAVSSDNNSVKIMTIHQSKGLEFRAVFLFASHKAAQKDRVKSKAVSLDKDYGILTKVPLDGNYFEDYYAAPIVQLYDYISAKKSLAEIKRLLYVGATRAEQFLFISAVQKDFNFPKDSFMYLILKGLNANPECNMHEIVSTLKFLISGEGGFSNKEKEIKLTIPMRKTVDETESPEIEPETTDTARHMFIEPIIDQQEEETISATKLTAYMQCPVKYYLTYELGYAPLFNQFRHSRNMFNSSSATDGVVKSLAAVKGKIIHYILEKNISTVQTDLIREIIKRELEFADQNDATIEKMHKSVVQSLDKYFASDIFRKISEFKNFRNEFEIHAKKNNYFLFGIIDKFILDGEKAIIVDFKSDDIEKSEIEKRKRTYFPQLNFYAYLAKRHIPALKHIEIKLIFLRFPEVDNSYDLNEGDIEKIGEFIESAVAGIRSGKYEKNTTHCSECFYANQDNQCVM